MKHDIKQNYIFREYNMLTCHKNIVSKNVQNFLLYLQILFLF